MGTACYDDCPVLGSPLRFYLGCSWTYQRYVHSGNGAAVVVLALFAVAFLHIFITYKVFGRSLNKVEGAPA